MTKLQSLVIVLTAAMGAAHADEAKKPAAWQPAPQMKQLEGLLGTWSCEGYENGKVAWKAKTTNELDFGGAWMKITFDGDPQTGEAPDGSHGEMGWDPAAKKFVFVVAHGDGVWGVATAAGLDKDRIAFMPTYPKAMPDVRSTFVIKDAHRVETYHEERAGKTWKSTLHQVCTK